MGSTNSVLIRTNLRPNPKKNMVYMGPYAVDDYNLTLCQLQYRVDSNTFTLGNPMPESTLILRQSRLYPPSQVLWIWPLATHLSLKNHIL
jgi:hypothetical protein